MIILFSLTPPFFLKFLARKNVKRMWVYLGKRKEVVKRLEKILGEEGNMCSDGKRLYSISQTLRPVFVQWIDAISLEGPPEPDWLFSMPAVKNTYSSNLFLYACYFFLFKELHDNSNKKINFVILDSPALGLTLKRNFRDEIVFPMINYLIIIVSIIKSILRSVWRFIHFFFDLWKRHLATRKVFHSRLKNLLAGKKNIVLIRNFIVKDFSVDEEDKFKKHFFPGLDAYLQRHGYTPIFFPVITQVSDYRVIFHKAKKSSVPIIFAEEFFHLIDYLSVMLSPLRALWYLPKSPPPFEDYDFSGLLKEEYASNTTELGFLFANLLARVGDRMVENGVFPLGIINWDENQALEKGLIYGLRKALPRIIVIGSMPFITAPNHLSVFPSKQDDLLRVTPDKVLVLGPVFRKAMQEFSPELNMAYTPAFRYANLTSFQPYNGDMPELLVLMGYSPENALQVMKLLNRTIHRLPKFKKVLIKLHPVGYFTTELFVRELEDSLPERYTFVHGKLEDYLTRVPFGICGSTGAALELVIRGIPVAIVGNRKTLTMNYLDYRKDPELWELCFCEDDLVTTLNRFQKSVTMDPVRLQKRGDAFRKAFFAPEGDDLWQNYIDFQ